MQTSPVESGRQDIPTYIGQEGKKRRSERRRQKELRRKRERGFLAREQYVSNKKFRGSGTRGKDTHGNEKGIVEYSSFCLRRVKSRVQISVKGLSRDGNVGNG